jgi:hypothetical protein
MTNMLVMRYPTCAGPPSATSTHNSKTKMKSISSPLVGCTICHALLKSSARCLEIQTQKPPRKQNSMGNQKFADFLVDFNTLSSQVNWGDRTLRHQLKQVLPDCIKDSLVLVEEPAAFNEWKRLVQNVDQRYWEQQAEICRDARPNPGTNTSCGTPVPNMCNTVSVAPTTSVMSTACGPPSNSPIACHLTMQGGLTQTERDRRITQGLCLYCGGQGHKASE